MKSEYDNSTMPESDYDFIVIGGGSGGNVVTTRLVEAGHRVLLLEAGETDNNLLVKAPAGIFKLTTTSRSLTHVTIPQEKAGGRPLYIPTGFTLGGGSSINGMIYIRGQPEDYDDWQAMGNTGWSWADCLPYFMKAESNQRLSNDHHGNDGPLPVSDPSYQHPLSQAFVKAAQQAGYDYNHDFNQPEARGNHHGQEGVGFYQTTTLRGTRASTAVAYLSRVRKSKKLTVKLKSPVSRILLDGRRAVGVMVRINGGAERKVMARRGVVLSAGALVTPKILMLSGIGPGEHLRSKGIDVVHDSAGVGKNLHDHLEVHVSGQTKEPISMVGQDKGLSKIRHGLEWVLFKQGMLTSNIVEAGGFFDTTGDGRPDIQIHVIPGINGDFDRAPLPGHGISLDPGFLRPRSRGKVLLRSNDAKDHALVDPHFLEDNYDVETLIRGVHLSRKIMEQPALANLLAKEIMPGAKVNTDAELDRFVRKYSKTVYHPVGTCRMGNDELGVVDTKLKVKGIDNLWISDASIMPQIVSGNTNAPTIMIGERASDFILNSI